MRKDPDRGLFCLDMSQNEFELYGTELDHNSQRLTINYLPCNLNLTHMGALDDRIPDDCIADLDQ